MPKKLTIEFVKKEIKKYNNNIEIISDEYHGNKVPLKCKCLICSHEWDAKWNNLTSNNSGCPNCYADSKLITLEEIKEYIMNAGYEFIEAKNIGQNNSRKIRITVICPEGHKYETSWNSFRSDKRCGKCGAKRTSLKTRNRLEDVLGKFGKFGIKVINPENYQNSKTPLNVVCGNGHSWTTSYNQFMNVLCCPNCKNGHPPKYDIDYVRNYLDNYGYILLSDTYINHDTLLECICDSGHNCRVRFGSFLIGRRCYECSFRKISYDFLVNIYSEEGYEIITNENEYKGTTYNIDVKCPNGHLWGSRPIEFIDRNVRCKYCYHESHSGENSPNWNPNLTDEDREKNRKFNEYQDWRNSVFKRDSYTCQCCRDNKGGNLIAHHLDGYSWCKERRIDVENGITLCENCHSLSDDSFHKIFGFKDNTTKQFVDWIFIMKDKNKMNNELFEKNLIRFKFYTI